MARLAEVRCRLRLNESRRAMGAEKAPRRRNVAGPEEAKDFRIGARIAPSRGQRLRQSPRAVVETPPGAFTRIISIGEGQPIMT